MPYGRVELLWWCTAAALAAMFLLTLAAYVIDQRMIGDNSVWTKPLKFEASLGLHFATLALIVGILDDSVRDAGWLQIIAVASVASTVFEIVYICVQAARQEPSHFNLTTPFYATMYVMMAIGAVVITIAALGVAIAAMVGGSGISPALRAGIVIGLAGGTILTLVTAFRIGGALNHHVGFEPAGAPRIPITGWSLSVGDRRVPHFFATHMMQAVPAFGWLAGAVLRPGPAIALVCAFGFAWIAVTLFLFNQANAGFPVLPVR